MYVAVFFFFSCRPSLISNTEQLISLTKQIENKLIIQRKNNAKTLVLCAFPFLYKTFPTMILSL